MPVDLDELFTSLARQSDALPIGTSAQARRRGEQRRNRSRAVLATAAAVLLILAGVGVINLRHRDAEPILPATTPSRIRGMAQLGDPVQPPAGETWRAARISGDRVIGLSNSELAAIDTRTGRRLWTVPGLSTSYLGVVATAKAVILVRSSDKQPEDIKGAEARVMEFHDPATGAERWTLPHTTDDRLVLHRDVLVRLAAGTGRITAYSLDSGKTLWSAPDRAKLISGMQTEADASEDHYGVSSALYMPESEKAFPYTDDRLISITAKGRVVIRNIRTGKVRSTVQGRPNPEGLSGYGGTVYTEEFSAGGRVPGTPARLLYAPRRPWNWNQAFPCGPDRLCLFEYRPVGDPAEEKAEAHLVVIDAKTGKVLRTTGAVPQNGSNAVRLGHIMTSGTGLKGTALYDEAGQARYSDNGIGGFIDDGNALTLTRDAGDGRFTARGISNIDFKKIELGTMPELSGRCDWNEDLLTCPTQQGLHTWRFTR